MITIPTALGAKGDARLTPQSGNSLKRILVIDDDEAIRHVSTIILSNAGYEVDAAEDGVEGWDALRASHFDLMITDNDMPRLSGVELIKKARRENISLAIILASGSLPVKELRCYPWLQIAATLIKPFSPDQLLDAAKRVLHTFVQVDFDPKTCIDNAAIDFRGASFYPKWGINE